MTECNHATLLLLEYTHCVTYQFTAFPEDHSRHPKLDVMINIHIMKGHTLLFDTTTGNVCAT